MGPNDQGGSPEGAPVCARCGAVSATELPLTWSVEVEAGERRHRCEACSRAALRAIEGRLDPEVWD